MSRLTPNEQMELNLVEDAADCVFKVSRLALHRRTRAAPIVYVRQLSMLALYEQFHWPRPRIARAFGKKCPSIVSHAAKVVRNRMETEPWARDQVSSFLRTIALFRTTL